MGSHVAETGIALLTGLSRGIAPAVLAQQEHRWDPSIEVDELTGKRALVVGAGGIGRALARRLDGLEVEVRAVDIYPQEPDAYIREARLVSEMPAMLPETDILAICCPSTAATQRLIDRSVFDLLPDGAYLINISRGAVVDTPALVEALRGGRLRGAGLDVLDQEPPPPDHPIWSFPNVMITPHNGGASPLRVVRIREFFASNLRRYKAGEPLENVVDVEAGILTRGRNSRARAVRRRPLSQPSPLAGDLCVARAGASERLLHALPGLSQEVPIDDAEVLGEVGLGVERSGELARLQRRHVEHG